MRGGAPRRVYGYCRVSSVGQEVRGTSLEGQREEIARWCAAQGYPAPTLQWSAGEFDRRAHEVNLLGVRLKTKTQIELNGHVLKRGAQPVGKTYYEAPISKWCDLYVFGVQTRAKRARGAAEGT